MAAMYTANHLGVKAIAALTETGSTVKWMSRISSGIPIYAMTRDRGDPPQGHGSSAASIR